ncbi:MAG: hypothetical protein EHM60_01470 [Lysobacterales bacterium]|jgi:hypothetical protein|nr:MAG: hypothetical protein EHM60_01470 [Xanthomonadales bacterium]
MNRSVVVFLLASFSAAAVAKHVYPKYLEPVEDGATYELAEDYVFKEKAATFTLFEGSYVVKFEDSKAVYLIGGSQCLEMSVVPPKNPDAAWADKWDCGVFLPKDPEKGAAFFMIRRTPGQPHSGNGWLIDEIIKAGYGSFDFPTSKHDDRSLRAQLVLIEP